MIKEVERDLFEMGINVQSATVQDMVVKDDKDYSMLELNGYGYKLTTDEKLIEMVLHGGGDINWLKAEFQERVSDELINPGGAYKFKRDLWEKYLHNGEFEYTYNERIREQLPYILKELHDKETTRQAVLTIYDQHKDMRNWGGKARIPCSMHFQFIVREGKLNLIYVMRSCDFLKHFMYDVGLALMLQRYVANNLQIETGNLTHFIGSLHAFKIDLDKRGIF